MLKNEKNSSIYQLNATVLSNCNSLKLNFFIILLFIICPVCIFDMANNNILHLFWLRGTGSTEEQLPPCPWKNCQILLYSYCFAPKLLLLPLPSCIASGALVLTDFIRHWLCVTGFVFQILYEGEGEMVYLAKIKLKWCIWCLLP